MILRSPIISGTATVNTLTPLMDWRPITGQDRLFVWAVCKDPTNGAHFVLRTAENTAYPDKSETELDPPAEGSDSTFITIDAGRTNWQLCAQSTPGQGQPPSPDVEVEWGIIGITEN